MEMVEEGIDQPKVTPKRMKDEEIMEKEVDDRISALPDCVLLEILSRLLYTEDAIRTGGLILLRRVKKLVFYRYYDPDDVSADLADIIEINAPNILSLKVLGNLLLWKLVLLNVSSLVEAELDYTKLGHSEITRKEANEEMLKGFIQSLRHVKVLKIGAYCSKVFFRLEDKGFKFPSNVKFPDVTYSYSESDESSDCDDDSLEQGDWSD